MKINYIQDNLETVLKKIENGALSVPSFQREFAWTSNQMADLMTSIVMRNEPFGSIVLWDDSSISTKIPQTNEIFKQITKTTNESTRQYLIDGQQRITSFAQLFLMEREDNAKYVTKGKRIYMNTKSLKTLEFVSKREVNGKYLFPAYHFFKNGDEFKAVVTTEFKKNEYSRMDPEQIVDLKVKLSELHTVFLNINMGVVKIDSDDLNEVIDVFTLINTKGKKLSPFNIVHASFTKVQTTFDLAKEFKKINNFVAKELNIKSKKSWEISNGLLMTMLYSNKDDTISNKTIIDLSSASDKANTTSKIALIKDKEGFRKNVLYTVKLLRDLGFSKIDSLPSSIYMNHISRFIEKTGGNTSVDNEQKILINKFFKKSILNKRHTSGNDGIKINGFLEDSNSLIKGNLDFAWENILEFQSDDILDQNYNGTSAMAKYITTKIMSELKSFKSGNKVSLEDKDEWKANQHHIFPANSIFKGEDSINSLANITPLEFDKNNDISNKEPVDYLTSISDDSLKLGLINKEFNDFQKFIKNRAQAIAEKLNNEW